MAEKLIRPAETDPITQIDSARQVTIQPGEITFGKAEVIDTTEQTASPATRLSYPEILGLMRLEDAITGADEYDPTDCAGEEEEEAETDEDFR